LFDASLFVDLHRLPELICGFGRRPGESPTLYPVACAPQTWASAAVFQLLGSALGLELQAPDRRLCFRRPKLPAVLEEVRGFNLKRGSWRLLLLPSAHREGSGDQRPPPDRRSGSADGALTNPRLRAPAGS